MKSYLSLVLVSFLVLLGCQTPLEAPARGSLTLVVQGQGARTILPADNTIASYRATGSGPSAATVTQSSNTGSFTIPNLAHGAWTFTVEGLDNGGSVVATGSSGAVTIGGGTPPTVPITLVLVTGTGTLDLTVSWTSGRPITAVTGTLTPDDGSSPTTLHFTVSGTSATYAGTLATGSTVLVVQALNGATVVARSRVEAVLIARGKTSSWSATLADDEFVSSAKDMTAFHFASPAATGTISGSNVVVMVPASTDLTNLVPYIAVSPGATVNPASGEARDFTSPVAYTLTAADGTAKSYTVTVTEAAPSTNANLSALTLSSGTLRPTFAPSTRQYSVILGLSALSLTVAGTKEDSTASLTGPITLTPPLKGQTATISVTSQSGVVQDYMTQVFALLGGAAQGHSRMYTGTGTTLAGKGTQGFADSSDGLLAQFNIPAAATTDGTDLYIADNGNGRIRRVSISNGAVSTVAGDGSPSLLYSPYGVTTDGTNLYIADRDNNRIRKVSVAGGVLSDVATGFSSPTSVTTDGTNLYVSDSGSNTIKKIVLASGVVSLLAGNGTAGWLDNNTGTLAQFSHPRGITTDGTSLYVVDKDNHRVRRIALDTGAVTTIAGNGLNGVLNHTTGTSAGFSGPLDITTDGVALYVVEEGSTNIRRIEISTWKVDSIPGPAGAVVPFGITTDGTSLYVSDRGAAKIFRVQ